MWHFSKLNSETSVFFNGSFQSLTVKQVDTLESTHLTEVEDELNNGHGSWELKRVLVCQCYCFPPATKVPQGTVSLKSRVLLNGCCLLIALIAPGR